MGVYLGHLSVALGRHTSLVVYEFTAKLLICMQNVRKIEKNVRVRKYTGKKRYEIRERR